MTTYYNQKSHDIGVVDPSTADVVGMMLLKAPSPINQRAFVPAWAEYDDQYLATQFFTDKPSYVNTPPEKRLVHSRANWRDSFGKEAHNDDEPSRYFASYGMDLSNEGMAIAGTTATAATLPTFIASAAVIANGDMEADSTWTGGGAGQSAAQAHGGSYSWLVNNSTEYQDATTWSDTWQGKTFRIVGWIYQANPNTGTIVIDDGVGTTSTATTTTTSAWVKVTVTRTLNAAATRLRITLTGTGAGDVYFDDVALYSPVDGTCPAYCHADFNSLMYFARGANLCKMNASGVMSHVTVLPASITCIEPFTDGKLYIALGHSNAYWEMTTGEVFTENTLAANTFKYFKLVRGATPIMWGNDSDYTIRYNDDPSNAGASAWSAATTVGASDKDITGLYSRSGALYIGWSQYPLYLDSSGNVKDDLAPELEAVSSSTSGKNADIWQDKLYYPAGAQALLEVGTANTYRNPSSYCTNLADFVGTVQAITHDESWLFVILDNSTKIEVLKCGNVNVDGTAKWVEHPVHELTLAGCETAWVSSIYQKRLWVSSTSSSDSLYYIPLPTGYGDITNDANRSFKTNTYFEDSFVHYNFKGDLKAFYKISVTMGHAYDADIHFNVFYKKLGDSLWTNIPTSKTTIEDCEDLWTPGSNVTGDLDTADKVVGSASGKYTIAAGATAGQLLCTEAVTSMDLSSYNYVKFYLKSSVALNAGDLQLLLDDSASCASPIETLNIPAISASTWTEVTIPLAARTSDTAIISVGLKMVVDKGAFVLNIDQVEACKGFVGTSSNRTATGYIPVDSSNVNPVSSMMRLKFQAMTDDTDKTPILLSYTLEAVLYPPTGKVFTAKVRTGKSIVNKDGIPEDYDTLIQTALNNARAATYPVTIYDLEGTSHTVKFLPLPADVPRRQPLAEQDNEVIEWIYSVIMQEVTLS